MNSEHVREMIDSCFMAKKITELMPELPEKMKPRHINVIEVVHRLSKNGNRVGTKDVSESLNVTMPSVTKLVNELEVLDVLKKGGSIEDKRTISLELTAKGEKYYNLYIKEYHQWLSTLFGEIEEKDVETTINTILSVYKLMSENKMEVNRDERS